MSEHDEDHKREADEQGDTPAPAEAESHAKHESHDEEDRTLDDTKTRSRATAAVPKPLDEPVSAASEAKPDDKPAKPKLADKKSALMGNLVFVVGFLLTLVIGYFVGQWVKVKFGETPAADSADRYRVELRGDEPQVGPDDALVTIIEFADYQCPYCADSVAPLMGAIKSYEGDVRLIFKHYPLPGHNRAAPAAYTAWAAHQQGKFWEFHHRLFEAKSSIEKVPEWVKEFGLDAGKFGTDMESSKAKQSVDSDMLAGAKVGVTGTPAFFVNGHLYRGKRSEIDWRKIIEGEMKYAKESVKGGVTRANLYEHLMKDALTRQPGAPDRPLGTTAEHDPTVYKIEIGDRDAHGPATALVTIVEFADYHCPYCSRVQADIDRLLEEFPNDVRVVYMQRPLPMHPNAREASKAALAAGKQGKFWEMHQKQFLRQLQTMEQFEKVAEELGLDLEQFRIDYASSEVAAQLAADQQLADAFGVSGTPAFFINGRYLSGAQPYDVFDAVVRERLAEAKEMVATGKVAPSEVYDAIMATAVSSPVKK